MTSEFMREVLTMYLCKSFHRVQGRIQDFGKGGGGGGSDKYIHSWGRVREGACLLP